MSNKLITYNGRVREFISGIVQNGLVLHLDAGNPTSYPGTGTTWTDLTTPQENGTLINGPTYSGDNQGSLVFDGIDDFIDFAQHSTQNFGTGNYTIQAWFKTTTSLRRTLLSRFDYDATGVIERGYYIDVLSNGKIRAAFETSGTHYRVTDSTTLVNSGAWFNVTAVRSNQTTINVYINSFFESSNTITLGTPTNIDTITAPLSIGRNFTYQKGSSAGGVNSFTGNIPVVQLYNRALTPTEITQNFNALRGRYGI